jgi:Raf kinase inhibitor-like YbhB/YbcL family protein
MDMPKDREQQTPLDPDDRTRIERTRGHGTTGSGEDLLPGEPGGPPHRIDLASDAFEDGDSLPPRYAHDRDNLSPPLEWSQPPQGTAELAVLCEDPDAPSGVFTHWVLAGLDPADTGLAEGEVPPGAIVGFNDFGEPGWGGPQPPPGDGPHRYVFTLFAASSPLHMPEDGSADDLRMALEGKELARGELVGMAERPA